MSSMVEQYEHFTKIAEEKYGENSFVFLQCGSFLEIYGKNRGDPVLEVCDRILNISVVKRDKTKDGYWIAGIPIHSSDKFANILLNNNFVVVYVTDISENMVGKKTKGITKILSPSCRLVDMEENEYYCGDETSSVLASILVYDANEISTCSICFANTHNGSLNIIPSMKGEMIILLEKCSEIITTHGNVSEVLLNITSQTEMFTQDILKSKLGIKGILTHIKTYDYSEANETFLDSKLYQRINMEKYFKKHKNIYQSIFENIGVQQGNDVGNLILMLQFLELHGEAFVKDLDVPCILKSVSDKTEKTVLCYNGVYEKMNIFSKNKNKHSIFEHINKTNTVAGKRKLSECLQNPITCPIKLNSRYDCVENFILHDDVLKVLKENLKICDYERLNRKVTLGLLKPTEIPRLYNCYKNIINIYNYFYRKINSSTFNCNVPDAKDWNSFINCNEFFDKTFQFEVCQIFSKKISGAYTGKNIFCNGIFPELDELFKNYDKYNIELEELCEMIGKSIEDTSGKVQTSGTRYVSISRTDKDGLYLNVTKLRCKNISEEMLLKNGITIDNSKSQSTLKSKFIRETSDKITKLEEKLGKEIDKYLRIKLEEININFSASVKEITDWTTLIDVYYSFAITAKTYNLKRPKIIQNELNESNFEVKGLRNILIENVLETQNKKYVVNDLSLSADSSLLLFGCNSAGKSAFLRAVSHAVILAQAGSFVPAESMTFTPYQKIFVRMGNSDEEHNSMSSFTKECSEMNQIVNYACKNSLIISDEACSTSETVSATIIVATLMEVLAIKRSSFFFVSHLFQLLDVPTIKSLPTLNICHLKVSISHENVLIFDRKLSQGCGNKEYGCLVAKKIINNQLFLKRLERNTNLFGKTEIKTEIKSKPKKSKYNKHILVQSCQICEYEPKTKTDKNLDVHHIVMQQDFKCGEYLEDLKKNQSSNLIVCCKECHQNIHKNIIQVNGYVQTENGNNLDFFFK
jgi:DNA mismatch repair protein MutS